MDAYISHGLQDVAKVIEKLTALELLKLAYKNGLTYEKIETEFETVLNIVRKV